MAFYTVITLYMVLLLLAVMALSRDPPLRHTVFAQMKIVVTGNAVVDHVDPNVDDRKLPGMVFEPLKRGRRSVPVVWPPQTSVNRHRPKSLRPALLRNLPFRPALRGPPFTPPNIRNRIALQWHGRE